MKTTLFLFAFFILFSCKKESISVEYTNEYHYTKGIIYIKAIDSPDTYSIIINSTPFKVGGLYLIYKNRYIVGDSLLYLSNQEHIYLTKN